MTSQRKRLICFIMLAILSVAIILTTLFLPLVHIKACAQTNTMPVVVDESFNLINMTNNNPFWTNLDAFDLYFTADGPIWIANAFILAHYIMIACFAVLFVLSIYEIATTCKNELTLKQNAIAKKFGILSGIIGTCIFALTLVSFIITNKMARGYVNFSYEAQGLIVFMLSLMTLIFAFISCKKAKEQKSVKWKNALGFALTFVFTALSVVLIFLPQFEEYFLLGRQSFWDVGFFANLIRPNEFPVGAEYVFGISQYAMFAIMFASAFLLIYSLIGFILCLCGRGVDWLSSRIKRWSFALLIAYIILYLLELSIISVTSVTCVIDNISMILPLFALSLFTPMLVCVSSNLVSVNKTVKNK